MFSLGFLWLIFLHQPGAAQEYTELNTHSARMGSSTTIPCKFNVDDIPPEQRTFTIMWDFQEKEIFRSPNSHKAPNSRLSIAEDRIKDGIADLHVSGVSIADGGLYKCFMVRTSEKRKREIRLDILAPPQMTITHRTVVIGKESVLRSVISGFYPVDIDIKWFRDEEILDNVIIGKPQRLSDGTYSVKSSAIIKPTEEDKERTFSCRIQHNFFNAPLLENFQLMVGDTEGSNHNNLVIIIPVTLGVGVVIIALILAIIIFCKKRKAKQAEKDAENQGIRVEKLISSSASGEPNVGNQEEHNTGVQDRGVQSRPEHHKKMQAKKEIKPLGNTDAANVCYEGYVKSMQSKFNKKP